MTRGKVGEDQSLGMPPPAPPADVPPLRRAPAIPNAKEPTIRQKMAGTAVRQD